MKYEVMWGENSYFHTQCGNQYQACLQTMDDVLKYKVRQPEMPMEPFRVTNLETGESEVIGLAEILAIKNLSANCDLSANYTDEVVLA